MKLAEPILKNFYPIPSQRRGSNPRRVTLIHKKEDELVCILARNIGEISFGEPLQDALVLKMFGKNRVAVEYEQEVTFYGRKISNEHYSVVDILNPISNKKKRKVIPYLRKESFVSDIIQDGNGLDTKIDNLITLANEHIIAICESIADNGIFRFPRSKKYQEVKENYRDAGARIYTDLSNLFHEEPDGKAVNKHDLRLTDRKLPKYFNDPRSSHQKMKAYASLGLSIPLISLFPFSMPDLLESDMRKRYSKRYGDIENDAERAAIALSEFALCNPKLIAGIRRGFTQIKAMGNVSVYSSQLALNAYALYNISPWISVPLSLATVITGTTMLANVLLTKGQDYSGVIPTLFDKAIRAKLKD